MIYSIGYSTVEMKDFIKILKRHRITDLLDCRTRPYSRFRPEFNRRALGESLVGVGIKYHFRGLNIGGKGKNVKYLQTLNEIKKEYGSGKNCVLMCVEEDYNKCHRRKLASYLISRGASVLDLNEKVQ